MNKATDTLTTLAADNPPGITTYEEYALIWAFRRLAPEEQADWLARLEALVATRGRGAGA